ncbi:NAD synthetase [Planococcus glaciei]|uniref:NH(3)-dependent NAD(+) synthetase n=1 Tax=Planococcus glaciei TaxID=459472 RepID=A0A1G8CA90_9BACL|nr:ammonia-dependent NAD(+) synthetase [Planococcus glaciei]ETP69469.1 NAD synthetase [Planococcus glaciei CHR43]KOF08778.1 NAD synthetase [Planococcus glaciei]MBX0316348.1 ammonia-dependent NAD(+) synthetase [Planococcus glaciei]QDY45979.1 ammonia-dependent NAD(+) synthetase [Planococcus glaciei]QKX51252.1 ammonia-dependent NAD(+) synthetase [Planococcus glaciei]
MSDLQKTIIEELKVQPSINPKEEIERTVSFLKEYLVKHPFLKGFVLGISGGQDSTLAGKLAQMAVDELNAEAGEAAYGFYAIRLPYGEQFDEHDAQDAIEFINPTKVYTVNIKEAVDASKRALDAAGIELTDFAKGNEKARERMKVQFSAAAMHNAVVLGTDHAAEAITGFYTKFGDGAADLTPLFRLNKRQGRAMLKELGSPEHLYMKIPTADLEEDKPAIPDEVALGITYDMIDDYLEGKKIPQDAQEKLEGYYLRSQHKRHLPITIFDDFWK